MELTPPKAILFDWDNTLVDTWPVIHEALNYCMDKMGKESWTIEKVKAEVAHSMRDYFPTLFGDKWEQAGEYYLEGYKQLHKDRLTALAGALEVLNAIDEAGIYQAIVSNKKGDTLRIEAEHIDWEDYFFAIIGSDDAPNDKPHPDHAYLALMGHEGAKDKSVWFVGDSAVDMEIAKNAGFTAIFYGEDAKARQVTHPIDAQVRNHAELLELLRRYL